MCFFWMAVDGSYRVFKSNTVILPQITQTSLSTDGGKPYAEAGELFPTQFAQFLYDIHSLVVRFLPLRRREGGSSLLSVGKLLLLGRSDSVARFCVLPANPHLVC